MANRLTHREYQQIKNESVTLIRFKAGVRQMTIAGCNYKEVIENMLRFPDCTFLVTTTRLPCTIDCIRDEKLLRSAYLTWLSDFEAGVVRRPLDYKHFLTNRIRLQKLQHLGL